MCATHGRRGGGCSREADTEVGVSAEEHGGQLLTQGPFRVNASCILSSAFLHTGGGVGAEADPGFMDPEVSTICGPLLEIENQL